MLKILILDDAKVIRTLLKMTLESDGIEVDSAVTIEEATQFIMQKKYDLMIVDFMLENNHNGLELVEVAKNQGKNTQTPCIMLSAEDGKTCRDEAQELGVKAWVKKPFTPTGILKVVYKVINIEYLDPKPANKSMHRHD
ncbi:response regulator [Thiomicrorhabdus sp. Kp2]|uniref:response regulator n=1 Tax=Thiomicrorhabdus sp. Kp2 TaxID=1123518 RepID=UPI0004146EC2|nr:response regulator [Thiomicrorhabdus sp. Kp2]